MDSIINLLLEKGIVAALFVYSFWFIINDGKEKSTSFRELYINLREEKEAQEESLKQLIITAKHLEENVTQITKDVDSIKKSIAKLKK